LAPLLQAPTIGEQPQQHTKTNMATGLALQPLTRIIGAIPRRHTKTNMATE